MTTMRWYRQAVLPAWSGAINWASDNLVATLHTSAYTPNPDLDAYVINLTGEVATGNGYTTGGLVLGSKSVTYTPANSWTVQWAPGTAYVFGQVVRPPTGNGQLFECVVAGTSAGSAPTWPAYGLTVTDGSVTWMAVGAGAALWNAGNLQWPGFTATFRYLVISDRQTGSPSTQPLIGYNDLGVSTTGSGGNLNFVWTPAVFTDAVA